MTFANGEWSEKAETIQFAEFSFTFTYHELLPKQQGAIQNPAPQKAVTTSKASALDADFESQTSSSDASKSTGPAHPIPGLDDDSSGIINLPPKSMADLLNQSNDFQMSQFYGSRTPLIAYWYGLCKFVTITPTRATDFISSESRAHVLLSSASIAINNMGW